MEGLKKKGGKLTRLTVIDDFVAEQGSTPRGKDVETPGGIYQKGIEETIIRIVQDDPFASIGEIKKTINKEHGDSSIGWWQVFRVLYRAKLITRRSRFKFARYRR